MIQLRFRERFVLGKCCHGVSDRSRSNLRAKVWAAHSAATVEIYQQFEFTRCAWCGFTLPSGRIPWRKLLPLNFSEI